MKTMHWLKGEAKALVVLFFYFLFYFSIFIILKKLILAHYHIGFYSSGAAIVGALIAAKAVLVIESSPLSRPFRSAAPLLKVIYDAFVYTTLALVFLYLEKVLELVHKEGTFRPAFLTAGHERDGYEFCAKVGCAGVAFLGYAVFAAISRHLGPGELLKLFFTSPRVKVECAPAPGADSSSKKS
ncbi:MAG TPA: hypothetical protein VGZ93_13380 [Candidatus Methylacidiphilales bacterium]|nr:hypothetical protein [Candidatus Methylacidiphilales bacterium]